MSFPAIRDVVDVVRDAQQVACRLADGRYVPARPVPFCSMFGRLKAAWLVFVGHADALTWPGQ